MKRQLWVGALLCCVGMAAVADPYVGFTAGKVDYSDDTFNSPTGFEGKLGKQFNEYAAVELSYLHFGDAVDDIAPEWELSTDTITLSTVLSYPVANGFSLNARLGGHRWDYFLREDGVGQIGRESGTSLFYGVGAAYLLDGKYQFGLNWARYEIKGGDITYPNASLNIFLK